jgi:hypothetical protein
MYKDELPEWDSFHRVNYQPSWINLKISCNEQKFQSENRLQTEKRFKLLRNVSFPLAGELITMVPLSFLIKHMGNSGISNWYQEPTGYPFRSVSLIGFAIRLIIDPVRFLRGNRPELDQKF